MSKRAQPERGAERGGSKGRTDPAKQFPERPLTLRLPVELVRRVDDLLPHVGGDLTYAALGRVSRSQVLRIALLEGVTLLRRRYGLESEATQHGADKVSDNVS